MIVDTGIITLGPPAVQALQAAPAALGRGPGGAPVPWDLYRDWLPLLAREAGPAPADAVGRALAGVSRGLSAGVAVPPEGLFVHLGTTRDFHDAVVGNTPLRRLFPFTSQRESAVESGAEVSGAYVGRSLLSRLTRLGRGAVVDHCRAAGVLDVGPDAVASGVAVPHGETLQVDPGRLCYQTFLVVPPAGPGAPDAAADGGAQPVTVVLGLDDNPKLALDEPGATLNGQPLPAWLATRRLAPEDVWPPSPAPGAGAAPAARTLWEAKLFVADAADPYRRILRWLQRPPAASEPSSRSRREERRAASQRSRTPGSPSASSGPGGPLEGPSAAADAAGGRCSQRRMRR